MPVEPLTRGQLHTLIKIATTKRDNAIRAASWQIRAAERELQALDAACAHAILLKRLSPEEYREDVSFPPEEPITAKRA